MDITPQQLYQEEKNRRKCCAFSGGLAVVTLIAASLGLAALFAIARSNKRRPLRMSDLRAAYNGLAPEDC
jgi:hypothetical protein